MVPREVHQDRVVWTGETRDGASSLFVFFDRLFFLRVPQSLLWSLKVVFVGPPKKMEKKLSMHRTSTNVKARSLSLPVNARTAPTGEHYCVFFSERYRPFLSLFPSLRNTTDWDVCPRVWFRTLHAPQVSLASSRRGPPKRRTQKCRGALAEGVFRGNRIFR